jgi:glycosyltransferase involved in cell wall biosynthesis
MRVSVIIPVYNGLSTIGACLAALRAQDGFEHPFEIILVDDASTDGTTALIERFMRTPSPSNASLRLLRQSTNRGPAAARNIGAVAATGEILLFTDADCEPERDWVAQMTAPLRAPHVAAVKGAYRTKQPELVARFAQAEFESRYRLLAQFEYVDVVFTYSAAIRATVFREVGGFDTGFPVPDNEDTDLSWKIVGAGHKIVFNPRAIVYHQHPDTLRSYLRKKYSRAYWRACVYRRFPGKAVKDSYTPQSLKFQILLAGLAGLGLVGTPLSGWGLALLVGSIGTFALTTLPFVLGMQQHRIDVRLAAPALILARAVVMGAGLVSVVPRLLRRNPLEHVST